MLMFFCFFVGFLMVYYFFFSLLHLFLMFELCMLFFFYNLYWYMEVFKMGWTLLFLFACFMVLEAILSLCLLVSYSRYSGYMVFYNDN